MSFYRSQAGLVVGLKGDGHVDDSRIDSRDAGDEAHISILSLPIESPIVIIMIIA
jgi:hypothetical protein